MNNSTNVSRLFGTKRTPRDPNGYIKTKKNSKSITFTVSEVFFYISGDPGP